MPPKATASKPAKTQTKSGKKQTTSKELSPGEKLTRLFKALYAQIDGGHFKNALKTCDKSEHFSAACPSQQLILVASSSD